MSKLVSVVGPVVGPVVAPVEVVGEGVVVVIAVLLGAEMVRGLGGQDARS
jgi:hypothetical protein